jgi:hypothetical protein
MHDLIQPATQAAKIALALSTPGNRARHAASQPTRMVEFVTLKRHKNGRLARGQMTRAMKHAHPKPKQRMPLWVAALLGTVPRRA